MSRGVAALLVAQFLSAFADNAILFVVIGIVLSGEAYGAWYVPALQSVFLVAFVVLAPWVGPIADRWPKPRILVAGNTVKALGAALILAGVEPLVGYAVVGVGAAVYGPAKYGVLPEIVGHRDLVRANGWIEGSTIFAIILGTVAGARLVEVDLASALWLVIVTLALSIAATAFMPRLGARGAAPGNALFAFASRTRHFFDTARARFSMLGASLFWAAAAALRVLIVAWAPLVLGLTAASDIAELTLVLAVGIIAGSLVAPRLVPIERLRRARMAGYLLGATIVVLALVGDLWAARIALVAIGVAGGVFVVPVNAALQEIGHRTIGSGGAVAIQNFFENLAMLAAVAVWTGAAAGGTHPGVGIGALGAIVIVATLLVAWRLPPDPNAEDGPAGGADGA